MPRPKLQTTEDVTGASRATGVDGSRRLLEVGGLGVPEDMWGPDDDCGAASLPLLPQVHPGLPSAAERRWDSADIAAGWPENMLSLKTEFQAQWSSRSSGVVPPLGRECERQRLTLVRVQVERPLGETLGLILRGTSIVGFRSKQAATGWQIGDQIIEVDHRRVVLLEDFETALRPGTFPVNVTVLRNVSALAEGGDSHRNLRGGSSTSSSSSSARQNPYIRALLQRRQELERSQYDVESPAAQLARRRSGTLATLVGATPDRAGTPATECSPFSDGPFERPCLASPSRSCQCVLRSGEPEFSRRLECSAPVPEHLQSSADVLPCCRHEEVVLLDWPPDLREVTGDAEG